LKISVAFQYVAAKGDCVIGIVIDATGDVFRIDIGTSEHASLAYVAFEGATKRNRPNVKIGDLVYARLLVASRGAQPELVCIDGKGKSSGMGVLQEGGYIVYTSSSHARRLLEPDCSLLRLLGNPLPYEVAVGLNGRIWIKGRSIKETLELANLITQSEHWSVDELKRAIKRLANSLAGF
jgi:exosome complex component RRP40